MRFWGPARAGVAENRESNRPFPLGQLQLLLSARDGDNREDDSGNGEPAHLLPPSFLL
jgi:hypothetical protein